MMAKDTCGKSILAVNKSAAIVKKIGSNADKNSQGGMVNKYVGLQRSRGTQLRQTNGKQQ